MSENTPSSPPAKPSARHTRRGFLALGAIGIVTGSAFAARWFNIWAETGDNALSAPDAHAAALSGDILLIDIRRPDEWALTGVGEGAIPLDMRRKDFITALMVEVGNDASRPVALICARGVRSRHQSAKLVDAGFTRIIDVPEGMLGSGAGPGWIKRGLPVRRES
ncbi:rhodanese-like domain-containing protein [Roseobacter sp. YSTF-M11]|uniref:Rhodanese-like domain-containing protein n=1 Tax=Roseobacter insulae TaxID=2859783 RepID=A0A9X1FXT4_9RHOB|nr:rhodanese-like domain-containing protein [Roseobacter insulae]MBW4709627.1 rhodanese-like domain-containing protein [Roseobacter insulae]